jgi:hypothetical protein
MEKCTGKKIKEIPLGLIAITTCVKEAYIDPYFVDFWALEWIRSDSTMTLHET